MPWLSQSLTAAQKSQQTIKAVYFQHRFYSTASTIGYRALLWRLYMPGWRHHQYPLNFSHLSEAKLTFSHLHFSGEVNQSQSVVELTWITFIMAAVVKSSSFPLWKSTRHLQQRRWLQSPSEVKPTSLQSQLGHLQCSTLSASFMKTHVKYLFQCQQHTHNPASQPALFNSHIQACAFLKVALYTQLIFVCQIPNHLFKKCEV